MNQHRASVRRRLEPLHLLVAPQEERFGAPGLSSLPLGFVHAVAPLAVPHRQDERLLFALEECALAHRRLRLLGRRAGPDVGELLDGALRDIERIDVVLPLEEHSPAFAIERGIGLG